jgi:CRISPR-associated protein Csm5
MDVEAVERGTVFHTAITVDEYGFRPEVAEQLGWQGKRDWLQRLTRLGKGHAEERLSLEVDYHRAMGPQPAVAFCTRRLKELRETPAPNEFLVQIGWGAGWESKTLGSSLVRQDDRAFERLLSQYRMTKEKDRKPGDPFPTSRHLVVRDGQPAVPLGWVRVRLEEG